MIFYPSFVTTLALLVWAMTAFGVPTPIEDGAVVKRSERYGAFGNHPWDEEANDVAKRGKSYGSGPYGNHPWDKEVNDVVKREDDGIMGEA